MPREEAMHEAISASQRFSQLFGDLVINLKGLLQFADKRSQSEPSEILWTMRCATNRWT